jgi:hypothetical protein
MYGFSCNIEALKNYHEAPLILWNTWTLIKSIFVAENEMIDDFLSTLESSNSSLINHLTDFKYQKMVQKSKIKSI